MKTSRRAKLAGVLALGLVATACAGSRVAEDKSQAQTTAAGASTPAGQASGAPASGAATGSGSAAAPADNGKMIAQLTFPSEADPSVGNLVNYNPYSPKPLTSSWLYEPLMIQNGMTCEITPWLATEYKWNADYTQLVFTIRDGVKWSDGQPFTAKDAAFTFNLAKQYPGLDKAGIWNETYGAPAKSVTASGNTVTLDFTGNAAAKFGAIVSAQTKILPEHVYSKVGDPTKYVDKEPVGTGPFKVGSYNGRQLELLRRDDYWQADKVKVQKLILSGTYEAPQAALALSNGQLDAYWGEIPNPEKTFVAKNPQTNHFWYAPNGINVLTPNLTKAPYNDPKFREAIAYAMDKDAASLKATYNIMKPADQAGLKLPAMEKMLPDKYAADGGAATVLPYDTAKAEQLLDAAGYKKGADGFRTNKDGSPLTINFSVQAGWIDFQAMADVVVNGLKAVGLNAKSTASAPDSVDQQKKSGNFDMLFEYLHGGCNFATGFGAKLASDQIPHKVGDVDTIFPNVERFKDPAVDAAVKKLGETADPAEQKALVGQLVEVMMTQYPVISLIYAPSRILYTTKNAVGWPSADNQYANPSDDRLIILTHLTAP